MTDEAPLGATTSEIGNRLGIDNADAVVVYSEPCEVWG